MPLVQGFGILFYGDSITESWRGTDGGSPCPRCTGTPDVRGLSPGKEGGVARQGELLPAEQLVGRLPYLHGGSSRAPQPRRLQVLKRHFGKYKPEVLGIGGDMTAHLWWRLLHGETPAKHHPKAVVLLIGTNDLGMVWQGEYCY